MPIGIPIRLRQEWNSHLRSLAALIQNHAGALVTGYNQISKTTISNIEEQIETARGILSRYYPLFPIFLSNENVDWLEDGHACMLKANIVPKSVQEELKGTTNKIIFVGLIIDKLTLYFIDGSKMEWIEKNGYNEINLELSKWEKVN